MSPIQSNNYVHVIMHLYKINFLNIKFLLKYSDLNVHHNSDIFTICLRDSKPKSVNAGNTKYALEQQQKGGLP